MAYSTVEEVRKVLIGRRAEDRAETANELDDDQIEYAIISADAEIDGAIRKRYKMPLALPLPALVHMISIDIAVYLSMLVFQNSLPVAAESPSALRYDRARKILNEIKFGRVMLDATEKVLLDDVMLTVFNPYDKPLFDTQHIFGTEYAEGTIPLNDVTHY